MGQSNLQLMYGKILDYLIFQIYVLDSDIDIKIRPTKIEINSPSTAFISDFILSF